MPSGSLPRPRPSGRTALRLLATLILALALAEPAAADSFGAEEVQEMEAMMAQEGVEMPAEVTVPEVSVPEVPVAAPEPVETAPVAPAPAPPATPEVPEPEVAAPEVSEPEVAEPVSVRVAEPPPSESPVPLGAGEAEPPDDEPAALLDELAEPVPTDEDTAAEPSPDVDDDPELALPPDVVPTAPAVPLNLNVDIRIFSPGDDGDVTQVIDMPQLLGMPSGGGASAPVDGPDLGLDWTWNWTWNWGCGGASAAGLEWNWNWNWDGACVPEALRGDWPDGARSVEDRVDGLLETLVPDGTSLADAVGGLDSGAGGFEDHTHLGNEVGPPAPTKRDARRRAPDSDRTAPAPALPFTSPTDGGGLAALTPPSTSGDEGLRMTAAMPAGGAAGLEPVRGPADAYPEPLALAAGLAPSSAGGGGGGGAFFALLFAALVGGLALLPPPACGRVQALQRRLTSLLSSSRLERPG